MLYIIGVRMHICANKEQADNMRLAQLETGGGGGEGPERSNEERPPHWPRHKASLCVRCLFLKLVGRG